MCVCIVSVSRASASGPELAELELSIPSMPSIDSASLQSKSGGIGIRSNVKKWLSTKSLSPREKDKPMGKRLDALTRIMKKQTFLVCLATFSTWTVFFAGALIDFYFTLSIPYDCTGLCVSLKRTHTHNTNKKT